MRLSAPYGDLLDAVRTLTWPARRRVSGTRTGSHASTLRGRAPELSEYRLYRQGDDPRDLDWKLLARSDRPFIRLADDRAILETWFLVDASASMAYPEPRLDKWSTAAALTVALASVAQRAGDPVALLVPQERAAVRIDPTTRRDLPQQIAMTLGAITPGGVGALTPVATLVPSRARVIVISDFLGDEAALRAWCAVHVSAGGEAVAVHVVSQQELDVPDEWALVRDPEVPTIERSVDDVSRRAYADSFAAWRDTIQRGWSALGASYVAVTAEDDPARGVRRIVDAARGAETR